MLSVPNMDQFTEDKWRVLPSSRLETVGIIQSKVSSLLILVHWSKKINLCGVIYVFMKCIVRHEHQDVNDQHWMSIWGTFYSEDTVIVVITIRSSEGSSTVYAMAGREQVFTCETCKRSFGYKHVLQNHERTHTGEKPFHCGLCEKKFTRDHHLKMHMRLHLGQKPYECTECDRKFVQVANLRRHLRVHTGERPYPCELCKSKFSDSNQLKSHMLIHKGEKPFKCIWCQRRFRRRQQLLNHKCSSKKDK